MPRILLGAAAALLLALSPSPAAAHETRDVGDGRYAVEVGFSEEPAYLSQPNALFLKVLAYGSDGGPVEGLAQSLEAVVEKDGATMPLALVPQAEPGVYQAGFLPTALGDYTFRLTGRIGDVQINEAFNSSPDTFASVEPLAEVQFPLAVPAGEELVRQLEAAEERAAGARTVAVVGVALGAIGLLAALLSLVLARRRGARRDA